MSHTCLSSSDTLFKSGGSKTSNAPRPSLMTLFSLSISISDNLATAHLLARFPDEKGLASRFTVALRDPKDLE